MEDKRDPRFQIHADLDEVQKDIEKAADERKSEIKQEIKDQKKSLKEEMKDLKQEAKDNYKEYKDYKKESDDPVADEKIATAKKASKVVTKSIDIDYNDTKDMIDKEGERRMESIDRMLDDTVSDDMISEQRQRNISDNRIMGAPMMGATLVEAATMGSAIMSDAPETSVSGNYTDQSDNIPPRGQSYEQNREGYLSDNSGKQSIATDYMPKEPKRPVCDSSRSDYDPNRLVREANNPVATDNQGLSSDNLSREYIRPDYEIRDTLITDDASDEILFIHEERDLRDDNEFTDRNDSEIRNNQPGMKSDKHSFGNKC